MDDNYLDYDPNDIPVRNFEPFPSGEYEFEIVGLERKVTNNGRGRYLPSSSRSPPGSRRAGASGNL
jgi:hypothetical protein